MKKLFLILLLSGTTCYASAQSKSVETLYSKYIKNKDFFHMNFGGNFLGVANSMNLNFGDMAAITKSVERVKLFKLPVSGDIAKADFKDLQKGLNRENFELMMEASEKSNGFIMYSKGRNKISDIVLLISNNKEGDYMVIALEGEFEAEALANAGKKGTE